MRKSVNFLEYGDSITCLLKHKEYYGLGTATYNPDSIEEQPSELTGKKVAYLKAKRDLLKQKLSDKKEHLNYLENFTNYLFPPKYDATLSDWLYPRADKYLDKIRDDIKQLEKGIKGIDNTLEDYLDRKRDFLKKLYEKRNRKNDNTSS